MCVIGLCVCGGGGICISYFSEDLHMTTPRHTEDSTPSKDPNMGPRKTLAKNAENVILGGSALQGLQWTSKITIYIYMRTHKSSEVLVIHVGGVCVCLGCMYV